MCQYKGTILTPFLCTPLDINLILDDLSQQMNE